MSPSLLNYKLELEGINIDCCFPLVQDGNLVFWEYADENRIQFYKIRPDGACESFGVVDNFYTSMKHSVLFDNSLCFMAGLTSSNNLRGSLIKLNINNGEVDVHYLEDNNAVVVSPICKYNNSILTFRSINGNKSTTTYIELYDMNGDVLGRYFYCYYHKISKEGARIRGICCNENSIFVLYFVSEGIDNERIFLSELNSEFNEISRIYIGQKNKYPFFDSYIISEMLCIDRFIFAFNGSMEGALFEIKNENKINCVYKKMDFDIANSYDQSKPLFYIRDSNKLFFIKNHEFKKSKMLLPKGYSICNLYYDEEYVFAILYNTEHKHEYFFMPKDVFLQFVK